MEPVARSREPESDAERRSLVRAAFEARTRELVEQFNAFEPVEGMKINGELTLGENIADLGGVTIAYAALQDALAETGSTPVATLPRSFTASLRACSTVSSPKRPSVIRRTRPFTRFSTMNDLVPDAVIRMPNPLRSASRRKACPPSGG